MPGQSKKNGLFGLVVCGGMSKRMGQDKSLLVYHGKPQCYHVYEMLLPCCEQVFVCCNNFQANKIEPAYSKIVDLPAYENIGPMAALLSAFNQYRDKDLVIVGCDYPFFTSSDLQHFLNSFQRNEMAAAFYNVAAGLYEPLLAYYNRRSAEPIIKMHANKAYSLQYFLKKNNAFKFFPANIKAMESVDTKENYMKAVKLIKQASD